jgi:dTDP-glucose 4,6-dehydratase/UDP-glucuronate decarboxylase
MDFSKNEYSRILKQVDTLKLKDTSVLITGANGLIGGFLADFFSYLNDEYDYNIKIILTSLSKNPSRINHLLNSPNITYIDTDLSKDDKLNLSKIDFCFYCAGYAQPSKFLAQSISTLRLNTIGVSNIFNDIFEINPKATCVYLSSSEVYSASTKQDAHCETDPINIDMSNKRNFYILGKVSGEMIVNKLRENGFNAISARVSLCYGPGVLQDDSRVLSEIVQKSLSDSETIQLFDDGSASRRYLYITDFTTMLLNIALYGTYNTYNLAGEEECSIFELASIVGEATNKSIQKGKSSSIVSATAPKVVWNSLERYKSEFGYVETKLLKDGVSEFLTWYKMNFY